MKLRYGIKLVCTALILLNSAPSVAMERNKNQKPSMFGSIFGPIKNNWGKIGTGIASIFTFGFVCKNPEVSKGVVKQGIGLVKDHPFYSMASIGGAIASYVGYNKLNNWYTECCKASKEAEK